MSGDLTTEAPMTVSVAAEEDEPPWVFPLKIVSIVALASLSAVFSGLNLGLMCLDANQLSMLVKAGAVEGADVLAKQQGRWAARILPLRQDGNTLLCTVLFGNVMVNSAMAILMADFGDGVVALLLTTFIIVTFGEIVPQSLCYKHGLRIGAALVPLLKVFWYLLLVVSKPTALVLDKVFGEEMGSVLDKQQMKALIDYQRRQAPHLLTEQEARVFGGAIDFATVSVESIMVKLGDCFCLDAHAVINPRLREAVANAGFSRVPVIDRDPKAPKRVMGVVGLVHVKDLLLLDVDYEVPLKSLLPLIGREPLVVDKDDPLPTILDEFRQGAAQLAVVSELVSLEDCDNFWRHVGILTLQDVLHTIIQEDVKEVDPDFMKEVSKDETDMNRMYMNVPIVKAPAPRTRRGSAPVSQMTANEVVAVAGFLIRQHSSLFGDVSYADLEAFLLQECSVVGGPPDDSTSRALYRRGDASSYALLILRGEVKAFAGREAFESIHGPWSMLGKGCLMAAHKLLTEATDSAKPMSSVDLGKLYVPDFTAYPAGAARRFDEECRILLLSVEPYMRLMKPHLNVSL